MAWGGRDKRVRRTVPSHRVVLVVARTSTSLDRLMCVLRLLETDSRFAIKFTLEPGSIWGNGVQQRLHEIRAEEWPWRRACRTRVDVVLAAHVSRNLGRLHGPVLTVLHGAGPARLVPWSTGGDPIASGLSPRQLIRGWRVIPQRICLPHDKHVEQLRSTCPRAVARAKVVGDPVYDWLSANLSSRSPHRAALGIPEECRLIVVSSTWGGQSLLGKHETLVHQLVAQLPADSFRVAIICHPNIWNGASGFEIRGFFRDVLDSGGMLVKPTVWLAALLAADAVVGDHGSVSVYGRALGLPSLQAADGLVELAPDSTIAEASRSAEKLDMGDDLREQINGVLRRPPPKGIADELFVLRGRSWEVLRGEIYHLADLDLPAVSVRIPQLPAADCFRGESVTSYLVDADVREADETGGLIGIERFPAILKSFGNVRGDFFQVTDDREADRRTRQSTEVFVLPISERPRSALEWAARTLVNYPGAKLAVAATPEGCVLRWRDGRIFEATIDAEAGAPGVFAAAAAAYGWWVTGHSMDREIALTVKMGVPEVRVVLRPMVSPVT